MNEAETSSPEVAPEAPAEETREAPPQIDERMRNEMARIPDKQQAIQDALKNLSDRKSVV